MDFQIVESFINEDKSKTLLIDIKPEFQNYFVFILEAHEGWCNHTMTNWENKKLLKIVVAPDFISSFEEVLAFLKGF